MNRTLRTLLLLLPIPALSTTTAAQTFELGFEIPRLNVAEYHRPYVAMWVARDDQSVVANLAVLYDLDMANNEGQKWLKDMRQWWRRSGRSLKMPVDGVAGATQAQGRHELKLADKVADLPPGEYRLVVEAVREVGGRELLEIPFQWPPREAQTLVAEGKEELGRVSLLIGP